MRSDPPPKTTLKPTGARFGGPRAMARAAWLLAGASVMIHAQAGVTHTNRLEYGWNLIAFQVVPTNASPGAVFSTNLFRSVWTYDNPSSQWSQFGRAAPGQPEQSFFLPMGPVQAGRAYWAFYDAGFSTNWAIDGLRPDGALALNFEQGWNLIGVPAGGAADVNVVSIFKPGDLAKIELVARWEATSQRFQLYDPRRPETSEFQLLNPNLGHWIKATTRLSIQPDLVVEAEGDIDLPPVTFPPVTSGVAWSPGPEDHDVGLPGAAPVFHDRTSQTTIRMAKGQTTLLLPLYNRGGGILLWNVSLLPGSAQGGAGGLTADQVEAVLSVSESHGVTSSETDTLRVFVDQTHLSPGTYLAKLRIDASTGQSKTFDLSIEAGGLDGQWQGFANIQTVNGKQNAVADVDLFLHLFQDNKSGSRQLRGLMDSQETLLWPMDAPVLGHLTDTPSGGYNPHYASRFVISGGFVQSPGDVNRHPFESFATDPEVGALDPETGLPYLTNAEGDRWYHTLPGRASQPDFLNPLPRFIAREVELIGQLVGSEGGAAVAQGDYYETISGMTPEPITLRGTFQLTRQAYSPLARRPFKYFAGVPLNGLGVGANAAISNQIEVLDRILINRLVVVVAQDAPADKHTLQLTGPNGVSITLHGGEALGPNKSIVFDSGDLPLDLFTLLEPPELRGARPLPTAGSTGLDVGLYEAKLRESIASYAVRRPRQSLGAFSDTDAFGTWRLHYANTDAGAAHALLGWSLLVYGTPAYPISGRIVVEGGAEADRFQDVSVQVLGLNADLDSGLTTLDRTTGQFTISCLPGLRLNLQATKPGYLTASIDGLNTPEDPRGYRDHLGGIVAGPGTTNLVLTLRLPPASTQAHVFTHQQSLGVVARNGTAAVIGASVALVASVPASDLAWELEWQGVGSPPVPWSATGLRQPTIDLDLPASAFTAANNFTLAYRARAYRMSDRTTIAWGDWVVVALQNAPPPPDASPYFNATLLQGTPLQGFGAVPGSVADGADPSGFTALHAQKTDMALVDVDRPPLIDSSTNPSFLFALDGLTSAAGDDAEDTDLHPRTFTVYAPGANGNQWAYATINPTTDLRLAPLTPPRPGQTPTYDDQDKGIAGRNINAPGEPVRIYTALGGRFCNLGVSSTDGTHRISAGANPGRD